MTCKMCQERGKTWNGDDPNCAFVGEFSDNWNCATLNAIRDICSDWNNPMPDGVDYRYCDDNKYATIYIDDMDPWIGFALWVQWYKNRGRTEQVWLLRHDGSRLPTEEELVRIIKHYNYKSVGSSKEG